MTKIITDKEKIIRYLDYKNISKNKFYTNTGLSVGFLDSGSSLGVDKLKIILDNYHDLNPDWFFDDEKPMLKEKENLPVAVKSESLQEGIPLIPLDAMAGYCKGEIQVMEYECEKYVIPAFREAEFLIPVKGSSMYPKYSSGDIVACKRVQLNDIFFQWNKVYVVDTNQGALIKRIRKGKDDEHILLVSENEKYEPFELKISQLHAIAIVIGVIRLE